ncbi:hypothetical protein ACLB2K_028884 [Fragaria x ananassa]
MAFTRTDNQSINNSLKQTYTVETFEHPRNPYVLSAPRLRSQSPSGLVSDFPIVALLALIVSIDRQVIRRVSSEIFPHQVTPEPSFAWLFEEMDEDGDNHISIPEVKKLLQEIQFTSLENDEEKEIAEVMKKFDVDNDGKISKDEFMNGFTKWLDEYKSLHKENTERSLEDMYQVIFCHTMYEFHICVCVCIYSRPRAKVRTALKVSTSLRSPPYDAGEGASPPQQTPAASPTTFHPRKLKFNGLSGEEKWSKTLLDCWGGGAPSPAPYSGERSDVRTLRPVFQPWIQNRRKEREMKTNLMSEVLRHIQGNSSLGAILTENGMPHKDNIRSLFEQIDRDRNNNISEAELRELIMNIKSGNIPLDVDESVNKLVEELDTSGDHMINEEEFVTGLTKWMNKSHDSQGLPSLESEDDLYQRTWDATDKLVDEETRSVLAEPLIDNVQDFSTAAGIPSFFVAFVLVPLATNARQAASAISAASRQTPRTTDLTFSEIYGGVFMNNVLGFSVLLAIIYVREMTWEFSAEVLVVLIVCLVVGLIASVGSTFPLWTAFVAFLLYPLSLLLVYILNDVIGYT